ncbi:hypothetical protein AB6819_09375 [Carnobacterium maltaromaticum]|uniref:hypothetical protein n=2 Tax=Carnobacterium maltaromaticum TaxID=2751 RepID=UPI0039BE7CD9
MRPNLTPQELEELRRITNRDPYPNNFPDDYDKTKVDPRVRLRTSAVKNKLIGLDTREAMEQAPEIISVVATEAKELSDETAQRQDELEERWETVLAETTDFAEVIDARTGLRGTSWPTIKGRLDSMQAIDDKLNPVSEVFSIEHNQFGYPTVRVLSLEYGLGVVPLESEPVFGGSSTVTINCDVEYVDRNNLKVKVPIGYAMTNPTTERISANQYLLVEGVKSLIIEVGTKAEANVETFVTREILSDFNTPPKIAGSNVENANNSKWNHKVSLGLPSDPWNSANQTYINMLYKLDNVAFTATTAAGASGMIPQMLTEFNALWILEKNFPSIFKNVSTTAEKVAIAKSKITKFQYKVWAKASGPTNTLCTHSLFNPLSKSWGTTVTSTGNNILERGIGSANTSTPAYLNADGFYYFVTYAEASNATTASSVSIDYTNITITARVPFSKFKEEIK